MSSRHLALANRLEANAVVERLVYGDGPTFAPEDARRLIALIPITRRPVVGFTALFSGFGTEARGHAVGIGDVKMSDDETRSIEMGIAPGYHLGGFVVRHHPGVVEIERMWAETAADGSGEACRLHYHRHLGTPERMTIAEQRAIRLFGVRLGYIVFVPWRVPGPG